MDEAGPFRPRARAPRGFSDRRGEALRAERRLLAAISGCFESFGFEPLETGALEYADALGKFLPDAERPNQGVFALRDDDEQWMALRYDLTAPLARYVAENIETLPRPFRRYAFGPVWRNEKPGPGHGRQFLQCDADTVGSALPEADAEIIAMALAAVHAAGLAEAQVEVAINSRKLLEGLLASVGIVEEGRRLIVLRAVDKLDRLGAEGVAALLGRGRKDESGAFTAGAELATAAIDAVLAFLCAGHGDRADTLTSLAGAIGDSSEGEAGLSELARIDEALKHLGIGETRAFFEPSIVRGLEYYTGAVFEARLTGAGLADPEEAARYGSVGGGGRYDDLVARFTGQGVPATGFSFGVSRLAAALEAGGAAAHARAAAPVVVLSLEPSCLGDYFALAAELRAAGLPAEVYLGASGMRAQMKYADRRGAPAVVILGEEERAAGTVTIKDLELGRRLAADVEDNTAWRRERPGQTTVAREGWVAEVVRLLRPRT
ncbi:MAG: histidine--tRNA ligase [Caulobacteraceae bacterium]